MIIGKPTKEDIELDDLRKFFRFHKLDINQFKIDGPRTTFPDFIAAQSGKILNIEITRAPTNERRMQGKNDYDEFLEYILPTLQQLGIKPAFVMADGPNLCSIDAYKHRDEIAEWAKSANVVAGESVSASFGECKLELRNMDGQRTLGFWIWQNPYSVNPEKIEKFSRQIAGYILDAIEKKIEKYDQRNVFCDLLLAKPDYWEPIQTSEPDELSTLMQIEGSELCARDWGANKLIDVIPKYFGEIWILMHNVTFRIFPVGQSQQQAAALRRFLW